MAFATIDVTKGITGTLPTANGGTGSTSTTFVNAATNVTGALPVANLPTIPVTKGGTGLTSGTTDQILKFTGTTTLASAAEAAGGKVGQVVSQTLAPCQSSTSATSYSDTSFSINITPSATSSKIFLTFDCGGVYHSNKGVGGLIRIRYNNDTTIYNTGTYTCYQGSSDMQIGSGCSVLHSPNTTSQKNYKIQIASRVDSGAWYIGHPNNSDTYGTFTAMEILA